MNVIQRNNQRSVKFIFGLIEFNHSNSFTLIEMNLIIIIISYY